MTSPFRIAPPRRPPLQAVERPRLLDALDGRYERKLTLVRAGAGFGKTTLLASAWVQNLQDPYGVDFWLSCSSDDNRPAAFGEGLCLAVAADLGSADPVAAVCDQLWKHSPGDVALILDDAHHIERGSESALMLERLVNELPANAHLVIGSRADLPFASTRLFANGDGVLISEAEMAFNAQEIGEFLDLRRMSSVKDAPGWPAILELLASSGAGQVDDYLWEEVLGALAPEKRRDLARLVSLEWIDDQRLHAIAGSRASLRDFVRDIPLTSVEPDGAIRLHRLWTDAVASVDPEWTDDAFAAACQYLAETGHHGEAIVLCTHHDRLDEIPRLLRDLASDGWMRTTPDAFDSALAKIPARSLSSPLGQLVLGISQLWRDPARAKSVLATSRVGLERGGDVAGELVALWALNLVGYWSNDASLQEEVAGRTLAIGTPEALGHHYLTLASRALIESDHERVMQMIDAARRQSVDLEGQEVHFEALVHLDTGHPTLAEAAIRAAMPSALPLHRAQLWACLFDALWFTGRVAPEQLSSLDRGLPAGASGRAQNSGLFEAVLSFMNASWGRLEVAQTQWQMASARSSIGAATTCALAVAQMAIDVERGDEAAARLGIESCLVDVSDAALHHRHALRGLTLASLLSPGLRERFARLPLGPAFAMADQSADALIAFREDRDPRLAAKLPWHEPNRFRIFLVPRLLSELALAATVGGNRDAEALCESLAHDYRDVLRSVSESPSEATATAARELLARVPSRPREALEIRVLGGLELRRHGRVVDDPVLRRGRVRDLLHLLVDAPTARREWLVETIWPELEPGAGANNLRVTLNHLLRLMEPDRATGAPSFFVRSARGSDELALARGRELHIDVEQFERAVEAAIQADRSGNPALELEHLEAAIALYSGEYLVDAREPHWGSLRRTRTRASFVRGTTRAAALHLGHGEIDRSLLLSERAIAADCLAETAYRTRAIAYMRRSDYRAAKETLSGCMAALAGEALAVSDETLRLARRVGVQLPSPNTTRGKPRG